MHTFNYSVWIDCAVVPATDIVDHDLDEICSQFLLITAMVAFPSPSGSEGSDIMLHPLVLLDFPSWV